MPVADANRFVEIEMDAQATPTFPRFFGFNSSVAMLNLGELKRQYNNHQEATERIKSAGAWQWLFALLFSLVFFVAGFMGTISVNDESSNLALGSGITWVVIFFFMIMGLGVGLLLGTFLSARVRYTAVYGETIIVDRTKEISEGRIVVGHTNLKRLGFIARNSKRFFFGPTQEASVTDGMIVLEVHSSSDVPLTDMKVGELYTLPPGKGDLTGNSPADAYAYVQLVQSAGEMERKLKSKRMKNLIEEGGFYLIMGIAIIAILLQAMSGYSVDVTSLDVTQLKDIAP